VVEKGNVVVASNLRECPGPGQEFGIVSLTEMPMVSSPSRPYRCGEPGMSLGRVPRRGTHRMLLVPLWSSPSMEH
jgi:hypothetical protein